MSPTMIAIIGIIVMLVIMFLRMPVGFAMALAGFLGMSYFLSPQAAFYILATDIWVQFSSYGLTVVPLFIFMGYICFNSGISVRLYDTAYKWVGQLRGGIAMATIVADEFFAAICGSNTATAATMGTVALPQMKKYGYDPALSTSTVATGGTLGVVIPPQCRPHCYRVANPAIHNQALLWRHFPRHPSGWLVSDYHLYYLPMEASLWSCWSKDKLQGEGSSFSWCVRGTGFICSGVRRSLCWLVYPY